MPGSAAGRGGHAAKSKGATTYPSRTSSAVSAGSQIAPDGTPNITTARGPLPSRAGRSAIHGPAQLNVAASDTGTSPSPRSASHARCSSASSGTSLAVAPETCATQAARVERSVWAGRGGGGKAAWGAPTLSAALSAAVGIRVRRGLRAPQRRLPAGGPEPVGAGPGGEAHAADGPRDGQQRPGRRGAGDAVVAEDEDGGGRSDARPDRQLAERDDGDQHGDGVEERR